MNNRLLSLAAWSMVAFIVFATLVPLGSRPQLTANPNYERFAAFAIAGFFLGLAHPKRFLTIVLFMIGLACGLEYLQRYAVNRHGGISDMSVKITGSLFGFFLAGLVLRFKSGHSGART